MLRRLEVRVNVNASLVEYGLEAIIKGMNARALVHHADPNSCIVHICDVSSPILPPYKLGCAGLHSLPCLERLSIEMTHATTGSLLHRTLEVRKHVLCSVVQLAVQHIALDVQLLAMLCSRCCRRLLLAAN